MSGYLGQGLTTVMSPSLPQPYLALAQPHHSLRCVSVLPCYTMLPCYPMLLLVHITTEAKLSFRESPFIHSNNWKVSPNF